MIGELVIGVGDLERSLKYDAWVSIYMELMDNPDFTHIRAEPIIHNVGLKILDEDPFSMTIYSCRFLLYDGDEVVGEFFEKYSHPEFVVDVVPVEMYRRTFIIMSLLATIDYRLGKMEESFSVGTSLDYSAGDYIDDIKPERFEIYKRMLNP
tara:strand:- start:134 stop:589 length:456 start_codon:yes stop_codon:yes gene_type:complete